MISVLALTNRMGVETMQLSLFILPAGYGMMFVRISGTRCWVWYLHSPQSSNDCVDYARHLPTCNTYEWETETNLSPLSQHVRSFPVAVMCWLAVSVNKTGARHKPVSTERMSSVKIGLFVLNNKKKKLLFFLLN